MARVAARISDKRVLKLIRAFLTAGVMEDGLVLPVDEGTPQGGPLSPLLSNLMLDDLDRELTRRGHRFCRYADDCNVYVRSHRIADVNEPLSPFRLDIYLMIEISPNCINSHHSHSVCLSILAFCSLLTVYPPSLLDLSSMLVPVCPQSA